MGEYALFWSVCNIPKPLTICKFWKRVFSAKRKYD